MEDRDKTKEQLIKELEALRLRVGELEKLGEERKRMEEALRQSEDNLKTYLESAPDGVYLNDSKGKFLYGNKKAEEIIGYEREELIGKSFLKLNLLPAKYLAKAGKLLALNAMGRRTGPDEFELTRNDGSRMWVEINTAPIKQAGKVVVIGFVRDITERKQAEEALVRSNAELEQFAYIASHDLQEPLRMVTSYVQLLARRYKGKLDKDADDFIGYAVDGATRMQRMINDLLNYSRVGTRGKEFRPTNCEDVLSHVLTNLKLAVEESGALVTHDPLPTVMADESQLVQLFQNLLSNAIRYRNQESPRVHVSAEQKVNEWVFAMSDNGIGIEPQYFDRIFQVFQHLHGGSHRGSSIGLATCKKIVERHGGHIWVESEVGKGSTFYFTIPLKEGGQS
jgi:PAS domain S-box-containing protein